MKYHIPKKDIYETIKKMGSEPRSTTIPGVVFDLGNDLTAFIPEFHRAKDGDPVFTGTFVLAIYADKTKELEAAQWRYSFYFKSIPLK